MQLQIAQQGTVLSINGIKYSAKPLEGADKIQGHFNLVKGKPAFPRGVKWYLTNNEGALVTSVQTDSWDDNAIFTALRRIMKRYFVVKVTAEELHRDFTA